MSKPLTEDEVDVLNTLMLRPNGAVFRALSLREAVLDLADKRMVCDPHTLGGGLFTRITREGKTEARALHKEDMK